MHVKQKELKRIRLLHCQEVYTQVTFYNTNKLCSNVIVKMSARRFAINELYNPKRDNSVRIDKSIHRNTGVWHLTPPVRLLNGFIEYVTVSLRVFN